MLSELSEALRVRWPLNSFAANAERALALFDTDPRRALMAAEALHNRHPESLDALALWAEACWRRGHVPEAARAFELLAAREPERAGAQAGVARCARALGQPKSPDAGSGRRADSHAAGRVPLHDRRGHRYVDIQINGVRAAALCDSGARGLLIAEHAIDSFQLERVQDIADVRELRLGTAEFAGVGATVYPLAPSFEFDVLLGTDLFRESAVEIDLERNEFAWMPSGSLAAGAPLWDTGHHWITPVRIDGEEEVAVIDTGSPFTIADDRLVRGEPYRGQSLPFRTLTMMTGEQEVFFAPRTEWVGEHFHLLLDCVTTHLLPELPPGAVRPSALLGVDLVRRARLDYAARRAVVEAWR